MIVIDPKVDGDNFIREGIYYVKIYPKVTFWD